MRADKTHGFDWPSSVGNRRQVRAGDQTEVATPHYSFPHLVPPQKSLKHPGNSPFLKALTMRKIPVKRINTNPQCILDS